MHQYTSRKNNSPSDITSPEGLKAMVENLQTEAVSPAVNKAANEHLAQLSPLHLLINGICFDSPKGRRLSPAEMVECLNDRATPQMRESYSLSAEGMQNNKSQSGADYQFNADDISVLKEQLTRTLRYPARH